MIKIGMLFVWLLAIVLFFLPANTQAQTSPNGVLIMTKKIQNPKTGEFVTTLSPSDATLESNRQVNFRVEITNSGSADLSNVQIKDQFPSNPDLLSFVSGPVGSNFDANTKVLSWTIGSLKKGGTQVFNIQTQIKPSSELPNQDIFCATNIIQAQDGQQTVLTNVAFCLQPRALQALAAGELPKTGLGMTKGFLSVASLYLGFKLRKFTLKDHLTANRIFEMRNLVKKGGEENE